MTSFSSKKPPSRKESYKSLSEAAGLLGVDYETARQYVDQGYLRAVRLPSSTAPGVSRRRIQVRYADIDGVRREACTWRGEITWILETKIHDRSY